jgi:glycine/D-amino acid oxidase-like deaminating enzyme
MNRRQFLEVSTAFSAAALLPGRPWSAPASIVVIGGGIVGASIAYHLARRGAQVTLCEKLRPAAGATGNSFAWINATYSKQPRAYFDLNVAGMAGWRRLDMELAGALKVQWGGCVEWYPAGTEADALHKDVARAQQWGYAAHLIDAGGFARLLPSVEPGPTAVAAFCEHEGTVDPVHVTQTILDRAKQAGAVLIYPCTVTDLIRSGNRIRGVMTTTVGGIEASAVVLAAGVDTGRIAAMADVRVPLKDSPGVLAHSAPTQRLLDRVALGPQAHMKQNPDGRVVTGSDFGGTPITDQSRATGERLLHNAAGYISDLTHAKLESVTLGWRVMPQDEYPILGFADACPNLYIAATHSGVTLAPLIGQFAATEILDGVRVEMLAPYRLSRFG